MLVFTIPSGQREHMIIGDSNNQYVVKLGEGAPFRSWMQVCGDQDHDADDSGTLT